MSLLAGNVAYFLFFFPFYAFFNRALGCDGVAFLILLCCQFPLKSCYQQETFRLFYHLFFLDDVIGQLYALYIIAVAGAEVCNRTCYTSIFLSLTTGSVDRLNCFFKRLKKKKKKMFILIVFAPLLAFLICFVFWPSFRTCGYCFVNCGFFVRQLYFFYNCFNRSIEG